MVPDRSAKKIASCAATCFDRDISKFEAALVIDTWQGKNLLPSLRIISVECPSLGKKNEFPATSTGFWPKKNRNLQTIVISMSRADRNAIWMLLTKATHVLHQTTMPRVVEIKRTKFFWSDRTTLFQNKLRKIRQDLLALRLWRFHGCLQSVSRLQTSVCGRFFWMHIYLHKNNWLQGKITTLSEIIWMSDSNVCSCHHNSWDKPTAVEFSKKNCLKNQVGILLSRQVDPTRFWNSWNRSLHLSIRCLQFSINYDKWTATTIERRDQTFCNSRLLFPRPRWRSNHFRTDFCNLQSFCQMFAALNYLTKIHSHWPLFWNPWCGEVHKMLSGPH